MYSFSLLFAPVQFTYSSFPNVYYEKVLTFTSDDTNVVLGIPFLLPSTYVKATLPGVNWYNNLSGLLLLKLVSNLSGSFKSLKTVPNFD